MQELTARQKKALRALKRFIRREGWPPTRMELADELNFASPNASASVLKALQKKGYIEIVPKVSRGIKVIKK